MFIDKILIFNSEGLTEGRPSTKEELKKKF